MGSWFRELASGRTGSALATTPGMRLVVGLFAMFLTASVARADEAKGPDPKPEAARTKVPLRVVRMLPESHQALLFDKNRGTHVLAEVGQTVDGYTVDDIDDDEVTLLSPAGKEIVLAAPGEVVEPAPRRAPKKTVAKADADAGPVDPYGAAPAPAGDAPIDPYADAPIRSVDAPAVISAGEGGVRIASAGPMANPYDEAAPLPAIVPPGTPKAAATPAIVPPGTPAFAPPGTPKAVAPSPASLGGFVPPGTPGPSAAPAPLAPAAPAVADPYGDAPATDAPPAPVITPTVLSRSELNVALADFNKLAGVLRGSFTPAGARLDAVAEGSVFAKAGLRSGDVVVSVDNTPLKSIDDAADLYVRAAATRAANIQILRAGKPMTLRVLFQ
jgi:membrane-associated protease RseP (regulator of RpoE activity)